MKKIILKAISFYQLIISPYLTPCCRFIPTCSHYAKEAIEKKGVVSGIYSAIKRLLKCHPFHAGGWDPII